MAVPMAVHEQSLSALAYRTGTIALFVSGIFLGTPTHRKRPGYTFALESRLISRTVTGG